MTTPAARVPKIAPGVDDMSPVRPMVVEVWRSETAKHLSRSEVGSPLNVSGQEPGVLIPGHGRRARNKQTSRLLWY